MIQNKEQKNRIWFSQLLLTAALALSVFGVLFALRDLFPLGDGSILMIDLHTQYVPLLYRFWDVVTGQKNLFLDLHAAGGAYLYADTINEVLNPFNYLLFLFGRERIWLAVNVLLAAYGTAASVTACLCLQRLWPKHKEWNVPLALCYGMSGFVAAQFQIIKWMYPVVLFPLFVLAARRVLREKKWGCYALLLGYQLVLSLQLGAMTLLFTLFGSGCYVWYSWRKQTTENPAGETIPALAAGTIAGVLLSAVVLWPNALQLLGSARGGENRSYWEIMRQHGLDDLFERIFQAAHPVLIAAGIAACAVLLIQRRKRLHGKTAAAGSVSAGRSAQEKENNTQIRALKYLVLWNLFLWITVLAQPSNLLWHLGSYMCFPVRYAYMLQLSEVVLVKGLLISAEEKTKRQQETSQQDTRVVEQQDAGSSEEAASCARRRIRKWDIGWKSGAAVAACLLSAGAACFLTFRWAMPISQGFSSLAVSNVPSVVVKLLVILGLCLAAGLLAMGSGRYRRMTLTIVSCVMAGCYFLFVMLPQDYVIREWNETAYEQMNAYYKENPERGNLVQEADNGDIFDRVEDHPDWPLNAALITDQYSMTGYFPSGSGQEYASAMEQLGYLTPWVSTRSVGGTAISDLLLGIRRSGGAERTLLDGRVFLTESLQDMQQSGEAAGAATSALMAQQRLGQILAGEEILSVLEMDELESTPDGSVSVTLEKKSILYLEAGEIAANLLFWVNGEATEVPENGSMESPGRIIALGTLEAGEVSVKVTDRSGNALSYVGRKLGILDCSRLDACLERLGCSAGGNEVQSGAAYTETEETSFPTEREQTDTGVTALTADQIQIEESKGRLRISLNEKNIGGTLFLPIAYSDGFSAKMNGTALEIQPLFGGFLGIELPQEQFADGGADSDRDRSTNGSAVVEITFAPPGWKLGAFLTVTGIIALLFSAFYQKRQRTMEADYPKGMNAEMVVSGESVSRKQNGLVRKCAVGLYLTVLILGLLLIYLVPNAGLAVNIAKRVLGIEEQAVPSDQPAFRLAQVVSTEDGIRADVVETNLMLNGKVRVKADSVENKEFSAQAVMDGITDEAQNRWSSENNWENNEHWLQADFREETQIVCVKLFWERTNVCEYALEYSQDQKNWMTAAHFEEAPTSKEQTILLENPITARYLRLHVFDVTKEEEDLSLYYQNVSLTEMEVYGELAGSFVIAAPQIPAGSGRVLELPKVPEPYSLRFGGADYANLIGADLQIADTLSEVSVELGFVLERDGLEWELPGMKTVIPGSGKTGVTIEYAAADCAAIWWPESVEWKSDGGFACLAAAAEIVISDKRSGAEENAAETGTETELLQQMADLFREELHQTAEALREEWQDVYQADSLGTIDRITFVLEDETTNHLGEEGCEVRITDSEVQILANTPQGIRWGCVSVQNLLEQTEESGGILPLGTLRDYPRYEVRGFGIDVGRRAISMELLYEMMRELSAHKMNTLQIHLNDNQIISQSEYDGTVEGARGLYSGFRLESDLKNEAGVGITSTDLYYTKEEFKKFIADAAVYGVEIIPEIDTPAHSLALTKVFPKLGMSGDPEAVDMLDLSRPEARELGKEIWTEYLTDGTFADCTALHLGMDEYFGDTEDYLTYVRELTEHVSSLAPEKELRIWGSLSMKGGNLTGISRNVRLHIWDTMWADPEEMYAEGFSLINSSSGSLYLIPGGGYDRLDVEFLEKEWQPNVYQTTERTWTIPAWSERCLGACYMMWNDWAVQNGDAITEESLFDRFAEPLPVIAGKLW